MTRLLAPVFLMAFFCVWALEGCKVSLPAAASPTATLTSTATPLPTATPVPPDPGKERWSFQTKGPIWGTPAVVDGVVYFGSDDNNLYALEAKSGALKWQFTAKGMARSRPAVADGKVYFTSDDGFLYALDAATGKQVWAVDIGNAEPKLLRDQLGSSPSPLGFDYLLSSPALDAAGRMVYAGSLDGQVYALDAQSGKVVWRYLTGDKVRATPCVADGAVYVGSWDMKMYALDALTGKLLWNQDIEGQVQTTALAADGLVYTASRKASVVALDAASGELKWEFPYGRNMWVESSPRLVDGIVYIGSSGSTMVVGIDAKDGKPFTMFMSQAFMWSTPVVSGSTLYIGGTGFKNTDIGGLYALKLGNGKFTQLTEYTWLFNTQQTLEASGNWSGVASSPVAVDEVVYFGGLDGKLYAVSQ